MENCVCCLRSEREEKEERDRDIIMRERDEIMTRMDHGPKVLSSSFVLPEG